MVCDVRLPWYDVGPRISCGQTCATWVSKDEKGGWMERRLPVLRLYLTTKVNRPTCTGTVLVSNVRHLPMLLLEKKESSCASVIFFPHDASNEVRAVNRERPDPRPLRSRDCRPISVDVQVEFWTTADELVTIIIVVILVRGPYAVITRRQRAYQCGYRPPFQNLILEVLQTRPIRKQRFSDHLHADAPRSLRILIRFERH